MTSREFDVVLFGATGFVGALVARHLAADPAGLRVALAGRSAPRLAALRSDLGEAAATWPLIVADAQDGGALAALAIRTRVVVSTVGPYARHGMPLVGACARTGTHYADLTGEVLFAHRSAERFHDVARASGARIVHSCGFDSVPSDLAVMLLASAARDAGDGGLTEATLVMESARGGVSGGTIDSLRHQLDEVRGDPSLARVVADPYALSPDRAGEPDLGPQPDGFLVSRGPGGRPVAPFVMGPYNTRVVRRSNALQQWGYGRSLRYREVMATGRGPLGYLGAAVTSTALAAVVRGLQTPGVRTALDRVMPSPGQGPSASVQASGYFRMTVHARAESGARYRVKVFAPGDPGYAATAVMLGQSALALALDDLPGEAGVLTPATGIGAPLVHRLRGNGFHFDVERQEMRGR